MRSTRLISGTEPARFRSTGPLIAWAIDETELRRGSRRLRPAPGHFDENNSPSPVSQRAETANRIVNYRRCRATAPR